MATLIALLLHAQTVRLYIVIYTAGPCTHGDAVRFHLGREFKLNLESTIRRALTTKQQPRIVIKVVIDRQLSHIDNISLPLSR